MLPSDVYDLKFTKPLDFSFMRAYIRAKQEWKVEDFDIHPPNTSEAFFRKLEIYGETST